MIMMIMTIGSIIVVVITVESVVISYGKTCLSRVCPSAMISVLCTVVIDDLWAR